MTSGGPGREPGTALFSAETFQNEYLTAGTGDIDAVITVRAAGAPDDGTAVAASERAEVIMIDASGSMYQDHKLQAAKAAAVAAVDCIEDGTRFAVVSGSNQARMVWPTDRHLAIASSSERVQARAAVGKLRAQGGTAISAWLDRARELLAASPARARHAILLTDGRNESEPPERLRAAVEASRGTFQCDCRGVGVDWEVEELRGIAAVLLGTVDIVADPDALADDFRHMITASQSRELPDVKLRLWAPQGAAILSLRQVAPEVLDLTGGGRPAGPQTSDFLLGGWAPGDVRDYHLRIRVRPAEVGDEAVATAELGLAVRLASQSGHRDTLRLLANVVDISDAARGDVTLRPQVGRAEQMTLDARSVRTIRAHGTGEVESTPG